MKRLICLFLVLSLSFTLFGFPSSTILAEDPPANGMLYGDVSGDGYVDVADYTLFRQYLLLMIPFTAEQKLCGDVSGDSWVDSADYTLMRQKLLLMIEYFPADKNNNHFVDEGDIIYSRSESNPVIDTVELIDQAGNTHVFDRINMGKGYTNYGDPGMPVLPQKTINVLLPPGSQNADIKVYPSTPEYIGSYNILPGQEGTRITDQGVSYTPPDPSVYGSDEIYPQNMLTNVIINECRGYTIAKLTVTPFKYFPLSGHLYFSPELIVKVEEPIPGIISDLYRGTPEDQEYVKKYVANPDRIFWYPQIPWPPHNYDMLIITDDSFYTEWSNYATWRTSRGIDTIVYKTSFIYSNYTGIDNAEKVRRFITYAYKELGIEYVLLGGDVETVPVRYLRSSEDIPSDLYYAGLDGTWDTNGNNIYGESGEEDWLAEVFVGRVNVDDNNQVYNFMDKVKDYALLDWSSDYRNELMMLGGDGLSGTSGGTYLDDTISKSCPSTLSYNKIYIPPYIPPCNSIVVNDLNNDTPHIVSHWGHGGTSGWSDFLSNSNVSSLTNSDYFMVYSVGCWTNAFDQTDAISENLIKDDNGAFAYIGNTRYGWYSPGYGGCPGGASSHEFERHFFDILYNGNPYIHQYRLGRLFQLHKENFAGSYKYSYYALNLLGDPSVRLKVHPELLIRDNAGDFGNLPSASPFWTSPDIIIDAPPYQSSPPYISENPEYGSVNRVYVNIHNKGPVMAPNVDVELYWANPAGGLPWPSAWNFIGAKTVPVINALSTHQEMFLWTPTGTAIGHRCLMATSDCYLDPIRTYNIPWENNIGLRNFNIVDFVDSAPYYTQFFINPSLEPVAKSLKVELLGAPPGFEAMVVIPPGVVYPDMPYEMHLVAGQQEVVETPPTIVVNQPEMVDLMIIPPPELPNEYLEFTLRVTELDNGNEIGGLDYLCKCNKMQDPSGGVFNIPNNTRRAANDLHLKFSCSVTTIYEMDPFQNWEGVTTSDLDLSNPTADVQPGQTVTIKVGGSSASGMNLVSYYWTKDGRKIP